MSVLIKGMDMPKGCEDCKFFYVGICHALTKTDCPLVPVQPHGDLIDRDMVFKKAWDIETFVDAVMNAPTVIPAEERGEDSDK